MKWIKVRRAQTSDLRPRRLRIPPHKISPDLPEIEGVDIMDGLKRVGGNRRLYRELLVKFAAKYADAGLQISSALQSR